MMSIKKMLSKRSNKPPWPGNRYPASFILARRLSQDSNKSPVIAAIEKRIDLMNILLKEEVNMST